METAVDAGRWRDLLGGRHLGAAAVLADAGFEDGFFIGDIGGVEQGHAERAEFGQCGFDARLIAGSAGDGQLQERHQANPRPFSLRSARRFSR